MFSTLSVLAQTDAEYSTVSSNQCSWCAVEFGLRRQDLIKAWTSRQPETFLNIYKECLAVASQKRKTFGTFLYGENIDSKNLLDHYASNITIAHTNTIRMHEDSEFLNILHPDLASEFYTRSYTDHVPLDEIVNRMPFNSFLLVSRHGQSLCVIRVHTNMFLILDSHLHIATMSSKEDTMTHIKMDNGGHTHLTLLFCV
jgi:hypothetical protein